MSLADLLETLYARRRFGIRPGVDRVATLLTRLGNPEKSFRSIHVVGTNGKGSTSAFLSAILWQAGHRTAQFSSPHLVRFCERFRINGRQTSDEKLADLLKQTLAAAPAEATFFEITTALACLLFSREQVEIAVMEAGMGGGSDATAAITAEMTIVTPIALDHADYLGSSLAQIAREKVRIIEPDTPVISAVQTDQVRMQLERRCRTGTNPLWTFGTDFSARWNRPGCLDYTGLDGVVLTVAPGIPGRYQGQNAALALAAAARLAATGTAIPAEAYECGVAQAVWPGRMELIPGHPPLLLDGAHNPAGAAALAEALADYDAARILLVTGVCCDKDATQIYAPLLPLVERIYTVTPQVERALTDVALSSLLLEQGRTSSPCGSVAEGICSARREAGPGDLVLVCGSLFVVGEAKAWLENVDYSGIRG